MHVILADAFGICFGVRDALAAIAEIVDPTDVTIHGELVHNETVLVQLDARGFRRTAEAGRTPVPASSTVLITAHGVSDRERQRLSAAGKTLIDTTCPLVSRAHHAAQKLQREGYHVLVIGRRGHVEIEGITGDLQSYDIVQNVDEVQTYAHARLGVVSQTTAAGREVELLLAAIRQRNPRAEIRQIDTVCQPTKDRQHALERLLAAVEAVVVVGGRNSNNTRQLADLCRERGVPAYHVQQAADLRAEWFASDSTIGLTAGTSTLDATVAEVHQALQQMNPPPIPQSKRQTVHVQFGSLTRPPIPARCASE